MKRHQLGIPSMFSPWVSLHLGLFLGLGVEISNESLPNNDAKNHARNKRRHALTEVAPHLHLHEWPN